MTDDLVLTYLAESREHLSAIEEDLLAIEAGGENIDEALVNKVFRAAHSIKGGAGFFDLHRIQELSHKTENVLDMIRSRRLVPSSENVSILLASFDKLREMFEDIDQSNSTDIDGLVAELVALCEEKPRVTVEPSEPEMMEIPLPDERLIISVVQSEFERVQKEGYLLCLVEYDISKDMVIDGRSPIEVMNSLKANGLVLGSVLDIETIGTLDSEQNGPMPFFVLFATRMPSSQLIEFLGVEEDKVLQFHGEEESDDEETAQIDPPSEAIAGEEKSKCPAQTTPPASPVEDAKPSAKASHSAAAQGENSLRVSVDLLESLMNLASELVLSRNQLMESIATGDLRLIKASGQRMNSVTSELQETIMLTRMQPVGNVLSKFPRVIRDLSRELKKDVHIQVLGREVEMDKTIIENLSDPLTHLVRNAVYHGIETPEERMRVGKNPLGIVSISVYHSAGQVMIEMSDDGKGIDVEKVCQIALSKGIITEDRLKTMSGSDKLSLILQPGLSTADVVNDVSGRGVGMDVVKTNLEKLGGKIDIKSEPGKGTTFRIKLPLTLAIVPSLLISVHGEKFAIPQVNVRELLRLSPAQASERIEAIGDADVLFLRDEMIPLVSLADLLEIQRSYEDEHGCMMPDRRKRLSDRRSRNRSIPHSQSSEPDTLVSANQYDERRSGERRYRSKSDTNIVIVTVGDSNYGLVVDELHDTLEIVVKPLGQHLKSHREYAGATIMGNGAVALILDCAGLAEKAGLKSGGDQLRAANAADSLKIGYSFEDEAYLLFCNGPHEHYAVSMSQVMSIERVRPDQIENTAGKRTMQFQDTTLSLVTLKDGLDVENLSTDQKLVVIVFDIAGRQIGLLAAMPIDIIEDEIEVDQLAVNQTGVEGSAIIDRQTVVILDVSEFIRSIIPEWFDQASVKAETDHEVSTVLLAEDSAFFRHQVKRFLEDEKYEVMVAEDGQEAWEILDAQGSRINMLVTDIEMPRMDGLSLVKTLRGDRRFEKLPVMAITSLAEDEDMMRGKSAGIDDYQIKLDKEKVIAGVRKLLTSTAGIE